MYKYVKLSFLGAYSLIDGIMTLKSLFRGSDLYAYKAGKPVFRDQRRWEEESQKHKCVLRFAASMCPIRVYFGNINASNRKL